MAIPSQRRQSLLICLGLAALVIAAYWPLHRSQFVSYDDDAYVTSNREVQQGLTGSGLMWALTSRHMGNWHPLTWASHMLDVELHGMWAGGHHVTNVLFHLANTLLLFGLLRWMTGAVWRSAMVAALFGLHPLHVESVAWVSERKDVLSTLFFLLTLWAYGRYAAKSEVRRSNSRFEIRDSRLRWYGLAVGFFVLGLMSKPMLVTLPFVLLLLDYWPLKRMRGDQWQVTSDKKECPVTCHVSRVTSLVREKVPFFALAAAACVVAYWAQQSGGSIVGGERLPVGVRASNAAISYLRYLAKAVWPANLAVSYPYQAWPPWSVAVAVVVLAGVTGWVAWRGWRERWLAVGWFWFVGTLVPVIGLVQVGSHAMADRYTYVPLIGLSILAVWGASELLGTRQHGRWMLRALGLVVVTACGVCSSVQIGYWRNSILLFNHALAVTVNNGMAHYALGNAFLQRGDLASAAAEFEQVLRLKPGFAEAHDSLATVLIGQGKLAEAILRCEQAVRLKPGEAKLHNNLGAAMFRAGRVTEAIEHYETALRLKPEYGDALFNLGLALDQTGRATEAAKHYEAAARVMPGYAEAHYRLGNALVQQGRLAEAARCYERAVRLQPGHVEARHNLGIALIQQGQVEEAVKHLEAAARQRPGDAGVAGNLGLALVQLGGKLAGEGKRADAMRHYRRAVELDGRRVEALNALAWMLATDTNGAIRNAEEAIGYAQRACELTTNSVAIYLDTLGVAYSEAGRFKEAVQVTERAAAQARQLGNQELAALIETRLEHYREGRPYHEIPKRAGP